MEKITASEKEFNALKEKLELKIEMVNNRGKNESDEKEKLEQELVKNYKILDE